MTITRLFMCRKKSRRAAANFTTLSSENEVLGQDLRSFLGALMRNPKVIDVPFFMPLGT
jgi:hypothetical protein